MNACDIFPLLCLPIFQPLLASCDAFPLLFRLSLQLLEYPESQYSSIQAACLHEPIDVGVLI